MKNPQLFLLLILLLAACQPISAAPTPFTPPPPTATDTVPTATTPPGEDLFTGSIELANGLCCAGGDTGTYIEVPIALSASSTASSVTEMRLAYRYATHELDLESAPWQRYFLSSNLRIEVITNWVGFEVCVQFKDAVRNLSEVYCDEISVEGMPAMPSPLLLLEYDLYWLNGTPAELMHFDYETQEVSCLVGNPAECDFVIEGGVKAYTFNDDKSKLLVHIHPSDETDWFDKLALLDLHTSDLIIFHEIDELASLINMALSPNGQWVAYQQRHHAPLADIPESFHTIRIVSTLGVASPVYASEHNAYGAFPIWSHDSRYVSFSGYDELWVVEHKGEKWVANTYFSDDNYAPHTPHSWSPASDQFLTHEWAHDDIRGFFVHYYLFDPIHEDHMELFRSGLGALSSNTIWLDGNTLAALETTGRGSYTQAAILYLAEIPINATSSTVRQYNLSFDHPGIAYLPHKLSETELTFTRITEKPDSSFWIEIYVFDTATEVLKPVSNCPFNHDDVAVLPNGTWAPGNDLLFFNSIGNAFILPTDGRACIDLNLRFGDGIYDLNWAP